jgi:hypothetical protein
MSRKKKAERDDLESGFGDNPSRYERNHALLTNLASEVSVMQNEIAWVKETFTEFRVAIEKRMDDFDRNQFYILTGIIISILLSILMLLVKAIYGI